MRRPGHDDSRQGAALNMLHVSSTRGLKEKNPLKNNAPNGQESHGRFGFGLVQIIYSKSLFISFFLPVGFVFCSGPPALSVFGSTVLLIHINLIISEYTSY